MSGALEVLAVGPQVLVQDRGRPGHAAIGVPVGGAADRRSAALAGRLVGDDAGRPLLEVLLGGLAVRARGAQVVAVTGAPGPVTVDGHPAAFAAPVRLADGQVLALGAPVAGLRSYLAVAGGLDVAPVLGSAGTSPVPRLGPPPVAAGDVLAVRGPRSTPPYGDPSVAAAGGWTPPPGGVTTVTAIVGPRHDWFAPGALPLLGRTRWVAGDGDRVGVRLDGPELPRARTDELLSEPMVPGSVQVPPDGRPIVMGRDHPTTGGYPVVAVLTGSSVDRMSQVRPGETVRILLHEACF
ncbi:biotin-dependent carboxyltransferase family protein [Lapillicoccus jejuensis]|uniref:Biotin-dependent carboxylase-like uncharacterized protein n=1 Tax=Lapillicoccus jejuensis TaxID=402171 RepID=A0A542DWH6_9MICO|nr:biotin-dependent carboxyltransferase family protein [Lapillicoccus jejuensis]TQJ07451.1 biotin-dependent carboxylase-like uncharacterized protein [Lapillicoccus jejuensis]